MLPGAHTPALDRLRAGQPARWRAATSHPFLEAVREGTLPAAAFATWLAQDAIFVADLLAFQARLVARAPRPAQGVLAGGVVGLVEELDWFDGLAARRGLDLAVPPQPATRAYAELLRRLDAAPYPDAVVGLWAIERVYLDAWSSASPGTGQDVEVVEHWTSPGFRQYVEGVAEAAERALAEREPAGGHDEALFESVLRQEVAFWDMAMPQPAAQEGAA